MEMMESVDVIREVLGAVWIDVDVDNAKDEYEQGDEDEDEDEECASDGDGEDDKGVATVLGVAVTLLSQEEKFMLQHSYDIRYVGDQLLVMLRCCLQFEHYCRWI
jgi:hypothetical protein